MRFANCLKWLNFGRGANTPSGSHSLATSLIEREVRAPPSSQKHETYPRRLQSLATRHAQVIGPRFEHEQIAPRETLFLRPPEQICGV